MDIVEWKESDALRRPVRHPWETTRFEILIDVLRRQLGPKCFELPLQVLDFGGGDGFIASSLAELVPRWTVDAVDTAYSKEVIQSLPIHENLKWFSSLDQWAKTAQPQSVKLVLMMDVLEHCEDDLATLRELCLLPLIAKDAVFFITVPAIQSLFSEHDKFLKHFRRYTYRRLEGVVRDARLQIAEGGYVFLSLLLPRYISKQLEVFGFGRGSGLGNYHSISVKDFALKKALWLDYVFGKTLRQWGLQPPGLSAYCVGKKV